VAAQDTRDLGRAFFMKLTRNPYSWGITILAVVLLLMDLHLARWFQVFLDVLIIGVLVATLIK
jgi:hypothetical protein